MIKRILDELEAANYILDKFSNSVLKNASYDDSMYKAVQGILVQLDNVISNLADIIDDNTTADYTEDEERLVQNILEYAAESIKDLENLVEDLTYLLDTVDSSISELYVDLERDTYNTTSKYSSYITDSISRVKTLAKTI